MFWLATTCSPKLVSIAHSLMSISKRCPVYAFLFRLHISTASSTTHTSKDCFHSSISITLPKDLIDCILSKLFSIFSCSSLQVKLSEVFSWLKTTSTLFKNTNLHLIGYLHLSLELWL